MFSQTVFKVAILALCSISLCGVFADNSLSRRSKRQSGAAAGFLNGGGPGGTLAGGVKALDDLLSLPRRPDCQNFGCQCSAKNECRCWAYCYGALSAKNTEWCYTTKGRSQDYNYVQCSGPQDCNGCWSCAGPCTV